MDKTNAIKLVEKTFGGEFNEDRYLEFVIEMFGGCGRGMGRRGGMGGQP